MLWSKQAPFRASTPEEPEQSQNANTRGDNDEEKSETVEGKASLYTQTITFEFCMRMRSDPELSSCQIFNNPNVGYTFVFRKGNSDTAVFSIDSTKIDITSFGDTSTSSVGDKGVKISIPINFTQDMGLLQESHWNCYVLISISGLKYKVGEFGIHYNETSLPSGEAGTSGATDAWIDDIWTN